MAPAEANSKTGTLPRSVIAQGSFFDRTFVRITNMWRDLADTVNRLRPGTAAYIERPNIGHSDNRYDDIVEAYPREGGTPAWAGAAEIMLHWLRGLQ